MEGAWLLAMATISASFLWCSELELKVSVRASSSAHRARYCSSLKVKESVEWGIHWWKHCDMFTIFSVVYLLTPLDLAPVLGTERDSFEFSLF